ncbi:MAG TPA: hypothetical protein VGN14_02770 [Candidatus Elarobacter sp.]|jgi:hypothetical protein
MTRRALSAILATGACGAALGILPCAANEPGYNVWFAGRVLSVDASRGRLRVARGPTETAGRGVEECVVDGADLRNVRPGMRIEAQADTRRRPWRVLHLRVMRRLPVTPAGETQTV